MDLSTITLSKGRHSSIDSGACLLEAASYLAGEPWSDHPACVSPVLGIYGRSLNDVLPDDLRQQLKPYIPRLLNTSGDGQDERRSYMALDWLVRVYTPTWMRLIPALCDQAALLESAHEVVDLNTAAEIGIIVREAAAQSAAAWDAARDAAWDAAWDAAGTVAWDAAGTVARDAARVAAGDAARVAAGDTARVAAGDAARVAARDAARAAAWAAARAAARDAARAAAGDALALTVATLQHSAIALLDRLIDPSFDHKETRP